MEAKLLGHPSCLPLTSKRETFLSLPFQWHMFCSWRSLTNNLSTIKWSKIRFFPWLFVESPWTCKTVWLELAGLSWSRAFLMAQMVKNPPARQKTSVQSLGQEDTWRREQLSTLVFLPGEFHGQRNLAGYSPWGHKESDTTEWLTFLVKVQAFHYQMVRLLQESRESPSALQIIFENY